MNKANERILNKAKSLIMTLKFDREWDNLWECSEEQSNNLIMNLYKEAQKSLYIKGYILENKRFMPEALSILVKSF